MSKSDKSKHSIKKWHDGGNSELEPSTCFHANIVVERSAINIIDCHNSNMVRRIMMILLSILGALFLHIIIFLFSFSHVVRPHAEHNQPIMISLQHMVESSAAVQSQQRQKAMQQEKDINALVDNSKGSTRIVKQVTYGDDYILHSSPDAGAAKNVKNGHGSGYGVATVIPTVNDPKFVYFTPPVYPKRAIALGQEGMVELQILINDKGVPVDIDIKHSSGYTLLDRAAVRAANQWVLEPAFQDGKPTNTWALIKYNFVLE